MNIRLNTPDVIHESFDNETVREEISKGAPGDKLVALWQAKQARMKPSPARSSAHFSRNSTMNNSSWPAHRKPSPSPPGRCPPAAGINMDERKLAIRVEWVNLRPDKTGGGPNPVFNRLISPPDGQKREAGRNL